MIVVGAYAAAASGATLPDPGWLGAACLGLPGVTGLELPFAGADSPWLNPSLADRFAEATPDARHVVTLLPALVRITRVDSSVGLASADGAGRRRALDLVDEARERVLALNAARPGLIAVVEVHSSPQRPFSSVSAFADSLSRLAELDWGGARLVVEHCDAWSDEHPVEKGYLALAEEIAAVREVGHPVLAGLAVNWGRSAIETRSADGASQHIAELVREGLLGGLMFSGAAPVATAFGRAWGDVHVPLAEFAVEEPSAARSLLTAAALRVSLEAAGGARPLYTGVKVAAAPSADDRARLRVIASALAALT
ncbi:MAG: hypothetical protein JWR01_551 [Subtercola sp.]|nr:hypothetical protein [Subtercola sp.]